MKVDLNCDMGESFGLYKMGNDEEMMQYITSANIACGYHAGDPSIMRETIERAKSHNVSIGAHPGFPDLLGFGRRHMNCTTSEIKGYITYQLGALREFASIYNMPLVHCKPHGAMYMMAMEDEAIAQSILEALVEIDENIITFAMNNSAVAEVGKKMGVRVALETYSDREHTESGSIVLTRTGTDIDNYDELAERVVRMVKDGKVKAHTGKDTDVIAETVCIHGDTPGADQLAKTIYKSLHKENIEVTNIQNIIS